MGLARRTFGLVMRNWWTKLTALVTTLAIVAFLPVPWLVARTDDPPGMAWRLDGRLRMNGETIDPPGIWYGLTAGRPPVLAEVVWSWIDPDAGKPRDMRTGSLFDSPALAEPSAFAVGLAQAGMTVSTATLIEARNPLVAGLPDRVWVSAVNGKEITSRGDWLLSLLTLGPTNEFVGGDGRSHTFAGPTFPYANVDVVRVPTDIDVSLAGWGQLIPESIYRNLRLGRSHGLLLALAAYSQYSGVDLAQGRVIGGTGILRNDGTVASIGGLAAKARAAHAVGVEVMVYPAAQQCQWESSDRPGLAGMTMVPVATLVEAIEVLTSDAPLADRPSPCQS